MGDARKYWSERRDLNSGPLAPHASALPGCATLRLDYSSLPSMGSTSRGRGARAGRNDTPISAPQCGASAPQDFQQLFELEPHLLHDLLALAHVDARLFAAELLTRATDREALLVQQAAYLADDDARPGVDSSAGCRGASRA